MAIPKTSLRAKFLVGFEIRGRPKTACTLVLFSRCFDLSSKPCSPGLHLACLLQVLFILQLFQEKQVGNFNIHIKFLVIARLYYAHSNFLRRVQPYIRVWF